MSNIKERILGAVTVMGEEDAQKIWEYILQEYAWSNIEEVEPDEIDKEMLQAIKDDPDCKEFLSLEEAMKELEIDG